ncbi:hypothetical protein [Desertivibrio insolitus]|uniref:hypothetical protein n=1 Tax=Herbiconiux sp. SYSU D00978 TaxID=2812562 RepID=UPI001A95FEDE|nr:hypothetical protein [Herbiconiux sp. SYSU D00978]
MNALEQQYRRALRLYPAEWRRSNEDVVVGTLLDAAEHEDRSIPRRGEIANLVLNAVNSRLTRVPSLSRAARDTAATTALAVGAAVALTSAMQLEAGTGAVRAFDPDIATLGPFTSPTVVVYGLWLGAFFAAIAGFRGTARASVAATIPAAVASRLIADAEGMFGRPTWTFLALLIALALLVVSGSPGRRWPAFVSTFLAATAVLLSVNAQTASAFQNPFWMDAPGFLGWFPALTLAAAAGVFARRQRALATAALVVTLPFTAAAVVNGGISQAASYALLVALGLVVVCAAPRLFGWRLTLERR